MPYFAVPAFAGSKWTLINKYDDCVAIIVSQSRRNVKHYVDMNDLNMCDNEKWQRWAVKVNATLYD